MTLRDFLPSLIAPSIWLIVSSLTPTAAPAASISSGFRVTGPALNCISNGSSPSFISGSIAQSDCGSASGFSGSFESSASASTTYGTLQASAEVAYEDIARGTSNYARGTALGISQFEDAIVLDVPGRTGEIVDLLWTFEINGSVLADISGNGGALVGQATGLLRTRVNGSSQYSAALSIDTGDNLISYNFGPGLVSITLGTPFEVWAELMAEANLDDAGNRSISDVYGLASALFGNSGGFTSFALVDSNDLPIENFSISSESGQFHFYGAVPEPGIAALMGLVMVGLLVAARRPLPGPRS